jgi:hypothetical protein
MQMALEPEARILCPSGTRQTNDSLRGAIEPDQITNRGYTLLIFLRFYLFFWRFDVAAAARYADCLRIRWPRSHLAAVIPASGRPAARHPQYEAERGHHGQTPAGRFVQGFTLFRPKQRFVFGRRQRASPCLRCSGIHISLNRCWWDSLTLKRSSRCFSVTDRRPRKSRETPAIAFALTTVDR